MVVHLKLNLDSSPNTVRKLKSRRIRLVGHVARTGDERSACRLLAVKHEGKRPLGRQHLNGPQRNKMCVDSN
jgi:hypothetical protein